MDTNDQVYTFEEFLADGLYVDRLSGSWSWSSPAEFDALLRKHFEEVHGSKGLTHAHWRFKKWKAVRVYVSQNMKSFDRADLAVAGSERALTHGRLWKPIFAYAIEHDVTKVSDFPKPEFFHPV